MVFSLCMMAWTKYLVNFLEGLNREFMILLSKPDNTFIYYFLKNMVLKSEWFLTRIKNNVNDFMNNLAKHKPKYELILILCWINLYNFKLFNKGRPQDLNFSKIYKNIDRRCSRSL